MATGVVGRDAGGRLLELNTVVDRDRKGKNDLRSVAA